MEGYLYIENTSVVVSMMASLKIDIVLKWKCLKSQEPINNDTDQLALKTTCLYKDHMLQIPRDILCMLFNLHIIIINTTCV